MAMCWAGAVSLYCPISNNVSLDSLFIWPHQTAWWQTIEWDLEAPLSFPPTHLVIKTLSGSSRFCEFTSERGGNFLRTYIFVASFKFLNSIPCAISKGSGVHLNKMHANSLTRLLFFQVFGLTELFCLLWCLYYKENGTTNERPLRSNLKEGQQEWILHIKGKGHKKETQNLLEFPKPVEWPLGPPFQIDLPVDEFFFRHKLHLMTTP